MKYAQILDVLTGAKIGAYIQVAGPDHAGVDAIGAGYRLGCIGGLEPLRRQDAGGWTIRFYIADSANPNNRADFASQLDGKITSIQEIVDSDV
jgi:hypothetical protein